MRFISGLTGGVCLLLVTTLLMSCSSRQHCAPVIDLSSKGRSNKLIKPQNYVIVQSGETLFTIAARHKIEPQTLALINGVRPPYAVYLGQKLYLSAQQPSSSNLISPKNKPTRLQQKQVTREVANIHWQWPAQGPLLLRFHQEGKGRGVDIGGSIGSPVKAAAKGVVVYSGNALKGYGRLIIIKHSEDFLTVYAHNRELKVKEGEKVWAGQDVATMGKTDTEQVRLHFEVRYKGNPVDPLQYLPKH